MTQKATAPQQMLSEAMLSAAVSVLGSMLIDEAAVGPMLMALQESDFVDPTQRNIFRAFRKLYGAGKAVDPVLINEELGGGYDKLLVDMMATTPTSANADEYAAALKKSARLWHLRDIGTALEQANDEDKCRELIDKANLLLCDRSGVLRLTMEQGFREFFKRHDQSKPTGHLKWGFPDLDEQLNVGPGDMVVIGGYPSAGKTAFALQVAFEMAKGKRVGFFSYETDRGKLHDRLIACQTHTSYTRINQGKLEYEDYGRVKDMRQYLTTPNFELLETSGMAVSDISAYAMSHHYDVIVIDYLQKIPAVRNGKYLSDFERVSQVSSDLQQLGRRTKMTVIALSQLSRPERKKDGSMDAPTVSSLRQSGQIEQDADVVMLLYKEKPEDRDNHVRCLDVAKNKDGVAGIGLLLNFDGDKQRFSKSLKQPIPQPTPEPPDQQSMFKPVHETGPTAFDQEDST